MSLSLSALPVLALSGLAHAAQPVVPGPLDGEEPFPVAIQDAVRSAITSCVATKPWVGTLDVRWAWREEGFAVQVGSMDADAPRDCVARAAGQIEPLRTVEEPLGASFRVGLDPAWLAAVTVEGGDPATRDELKERFARCAVGTKLETWYGVEIEAQKVPGYDAPVGAVRRAPAAPASEAADAVASCATRDYLTSKGQKPGTTTALVGLRTSVGPAVALTLKPESPLDPAAQKGIERIVGGCARQEGWRGTVTYVLEVQAGSHFAGTMNSEVPPAVQACLQGSAPLGVPLGRYTVEATAR